MATTSTAVTSSGSVIDVQSIVSQLISAQSAPLTKLQSTATSLTTSISSFGTIKSQLSAFQDAARALSTATTWQATSPTSSDETTLKVTSSPSAAAANMSIVVSQLAQAQSAVSTSTYASGAAVLGGGSLSIQLGSVAAGGFTADTDRSAITLNIAAGSTLAQVRDAINAADAGVTATLVSDSGQSRLMLRSATTGAENAFQIQASGDAGIAALAYTPGTTGGGMTTAQTAQDARYAIDGVQLSAPTNTIENALDGVNLSLQKVSATPVNVSIASDQKSIRDAVDKFVAAYNSLDATIASLTKYDQTTKVAGNLQGNSIVVGLRNKMRDLVTQTVTGGNYGTLNSIGITLQRDGSLKVDDARFNAAAANPSNLRTLFVGSRQSAETTGIAARLGDFVSSTLGVDGAVTNALETLNSRKTNNQRQQDDFSDRLTQLQARLVKTYSALDAKLASLQSLSASLTSSLAGLTNLNNNS